MDAQLPVAAGALEAHERAEGDGGPRWVLRWAVEADLHKSMRGRVCVRQVARDREGAERRAFSSRTLHARAEEDSLEHGMHKAVAMVGEQPVTFSSFAIFIWRKKASSTGLGTWASGSSTGMADCCARVRRERVQAPAPANRAARESPGKQVSAKARRWVLAPADVHCEDF